MMNPENVIEVNNVYKTFKVYPDKGHTLKEKILFPNRKNYFERKVLRGVSFSVKKGEAIGLIGENGCGKSTTLKLLTKIIYPDQGTIEMKGRVSSLLELGAGFHPDMSGRENIYINASIFGLTSKEIDKRVDEIIEFSELGEAIDNPVRTYSSGMYMRLAFSVAINVDADILLIDEILAVGDAAYQAKCFNKLREIKAGGATIVIVSHAMAQIEQICERSIWIHEGLIREIGSPRVVDPKYMEYMSRKEYEAQKKIEEQKVTKEKAEKEATEETADGVDSDLQERTEDSVQINSTQQAENTKRWGSGEVIIENVDVLDSDNNVCSVFGPQDEINIRIKYKTKKKVDDVVIGIAIYRSDQVHIYGTNTLIDYAEPFSLNGEGYIDLKIHGIGLNAGNYSMDFAFHKPDGFNYDFWREVCEIRINNPHAEAGIISIKHDWLIK